jgi:hypothetical protein
VIYRPSVTTFHGINLDKKLAFSWLLSNANLSSSRSFFEASSAAGPSLDPAGDAGIVLSLFLAGSVPAGAAFVADDVAFTGLEVLATAAVVGRAALVAGFDVAFVGLASAAVRLATGFFSVAEGPMVVRRDGADEDCFTSVALLGAGAGARDARLAVPDTIGLLFSASGLVADFFDSSAELIDGFGWCAELEAVAPVAPAAGRRAVELANGRVGGLLRAPPAVARAAGDAVAFVAGFNAGAEGRFAVVAGRLGGTPFLAGAASSVVPGAGAGLSSPESTSAEVSSAGGATGSSAGASASAEAMAASGRWRRGARWGCSGAGCRGRLVVRAAGRESQ